MTRRALCLLVPVLVVFAGCGKDDGANVQSASNTGSSSGSTSTAGCKVVGGVDTTKVADLHVTLDEYTIAYEEDGATAGVVQFEAANKGDEDHELVVVKGSKADLPVTDGVVDEEGIELTGEIEPFAAGEECVGKFELTAGTYTLFCGIVEADSGQSHFQEGMVAELEVK